MASWAETGAAVQLTGELDDLEHALDLANKVLYQGLSGPAKAEAMNTVLRLQNKFDALDGPRHALVRSHPGTPPRGPRIGHRLGQDPPATSRVVDLSRRRRLPTASATSPSAERAMADGLDHRRARRRASIGPTGCIGPTSFRVVEELLVDSAIEERFVDFEQPSSTSSSAPRPTTQTTGPSRKIDERYACSSRFGSHGKVDAQMDDLAFSVWQAELDRQMDHLLEQDRAEARDRLGRAPLHSELRRTTRNARVDAMVDDGPPLRGLQRKRTSAQPVHGQRARRPRLPHRPHRRPRPSDERDDDPTFDLDDARPRSSSPRTRCTSSTTARSSRSTPSCSPCSPAPSGGSSTTRTARSSGTAGPAASSPPPNAQLGQALYRRCAHPWGCDRTGAPTQTDHTVEFQDGGLTDTDNGKRYCGPHNIWKTNHRFDPPPPGAPPPDTGQRRTPRRPGRRRRAIEQAA